MSLSCPSCHSVLAADARFCPSCGAPAPTSTPAAPADPVREVLKVALGRQYEIQHLLGKGGMGAVYLATEAALEREVAIKVLPPDRGATKDSRDRFRREARTAAKLSHPNIVPLYTFGDVDGTLYFVMGYVKGESLAARLKREGRLPNEDARRILIELCDALEYAHKVGVIHRDIKPDNVLLEEGTGRALLTDFGVAKALGAGQTMTEVGSVLGTPQYMSPEQAQGKADIDHRSDLYSLGVMGYAMLAGRLPFDGGTPAEIMAQHITKEAPTLSSLAPGIPAEITAALVRCLAKDREQRWRDARGLKDALSALDSNEALEEFEDLPKMFWFMVLGGVFLEYLAAFWLGGGDTSDPFPAVPGVVTAICAFLGVGLGVRFQQLRKESFEASRIVWEIFRQPDAWMGWYPRRFRKRGDIWDRLPRELRRARTSMTVAIGAGLLVMGPYMVFSTAFTSHIRRTGHSPYPTDLRQGPLHLMVGLVVAVLAAAFVQIALWQKRARRAGLDEKSAARTLDTPSARRSFWLRPEVAVLLGRETTPAPTRIPGEPTTPIGLAAGVGAAARGFPEPARTLGSRADAAARHLAGAIALLDKQIASLERAFDPAEAGRLADRMAALEAEAGAADENREVRSLLQRQIETVRSFEARIQDATTRREKLLATLKALWLQAVGLQGASAEPAKTGEATERMQNVLAQIEGYSAQEVLAAPNAATHPLADAPTLDR